MYTKMSYVLMICLFFIRWNAMAETPQLISYQGFLSDSEGPVTGTRSMIFSIYDVAESGSWLWSSGTVEIEVVDGLFNYMLGSEISLLPEYLSGSYRWLGIQILPDDEITPRTRLGAVPYSYQSLSADTADVGGGWTVGTGQRGPVIHPVDLGASVGIGQEDPGNHRLFVQSSNDGIGGTTAFISNTGAEGIGMIVENNSPGLAMIVSQKGEHSDGEIFRCDSWTGGWHSVFRVMNSGRVICDELELIGGADLAESFEISGEFVPTPGALLVIDDMNPGKLTLSCNPYDTRVAGIVSGAGGVNPGITLTQTDYFDSGPYIAISGRVYCLADASYGAIKPGDLLTTSSTPGYAMKATDRGRSYGAIIGKAMTGLAEGQGLVLVLVSLQ